jgi:hypothetical protein
MIRLLSASIIMGIQCASAVGIHVPEGWEQAQVPAHEVPYQMPPAIRPMMRLLPPGKSGTVSIGEMKAAVSLDEAAKRYARGIPMRGVTIDSTTPVTLQGHEGRHIKGHRSVGASTSTVPVEVYIIMTPESILSVEVISHDASSMINDVLTWIDFQAPASPSKASNASGGEDGHDGR